MGQLGPSATVEGTDPVLNKLPFCLPGPNTAVSRRAGVRTLVSLLVSRRDALALKERRTIWMGKRPGDPGQTSASTWQRQKNLHREFLLPVPVLTDAMKRVVREQRLGFVATVSEDGSPNVSPKGSLTVLDDDHLVFADVESPHTVLNLSKNPRTEINVVDPLLRKGYRFRGKATVLHTGTAYWKVLEMYRAEGADVRRVRSVVIVAVEHVAPLISPIYLVGHHPEDEVRALWQEFYRKSRDRTVVDLIPPQEF